MQRERGLIRGSSFICAGFEAMAGNASSRCTYPQDRNVYAAAGERQHAAPQRSGQLQTCGDQTKKAAHTAAFFVISSAYSPSY